MNRVPWNPAIVAVYKKSETAKKYYIDVFPTLKVDDVIADGRRNPPIPNEYYLELVTVGTGSLEKIQEKYSVKKVNIRK